VLASPTLDVLFSALSVDIEAFAICEISENIGLVFPPIEAIEVHHILEGRLHLTIDGGKPIEVGPGSMVIVPPGRTQHLAASPSVATSRRASDIVIPVRDGMVVLDATEGQPTVLRIACGIVVVDSPGSYGPLEGISRYIAEDLSDVPVISAAFSAMLGEAADPSEGSMALTSALMKACLVFLVRRHLKTSREAAIPPALPSDTRLSRAIAAVLDRPAEAHSVATLAKEAGMSRSAFSRQFKATTDETPMEFVTRVRLEYARRLLLGTARPVEAIASSIGFRSRSHFSRAFREQFGSDPSAFRRRNGNAPR
jgi:AraC family transcriptional activator of mtrCDE